MATLIQGNSVTVTVLPGQVLSIVAGSTSTGSVSRLGDNPGEAPQGVTAISSSTTTVKGPYPAAARFLIECDGDSLSYAVGQLDVADYVDDAVTEAINALPAAEVTPLTDSTGGTPGATLAAVGATNTGDRSAAINDNFASLNAQIEALKTSLVTAGLLTAYVAP